MAQAIERYLSEELFLKQSLHQQKTQRGHLAYWSAALGRYVLAGLTRDLIAKKRDELLKRKKPDGSAYSPTTARHYLVSLSAVLTAAVKDWGLLESNPLDQIRKPKAARGRVRFLSESEMAALLKACQSSPNQHVYAVTVLALHTGMRKGEILSLTWKAVDFKERRITLEKTKNGDRRSIPLAGDALTVLQALSKVRRIDSGLVFVGKSGQQAHIDKAFREAVAQAGIEDFVFHDCRHTTASLLAQAGVSSLQIKEVPGHRTLQMVARYSHLAPNSTRGVLEQLAEKIK